MVPFAASGADLAATSGAISAVSGIAPFRISAAVRIVALGFRGGRISSQFRSAISFDVTDFLAPITSFWWIVGVFVLVNVPAAVSAFTAAVLEVPANLAFPFLTILGIILVGIAASLSGLFRVVFVDAEFVRFGVPDQVRVVLWIVRDQCVDLVLDR